MTPAELRALLAKSIPSGPVRCRGCGPEPHTHYPDCAEMRDYYQCAEARKELTAAARNALPKLLDAVEAAQRYDEAVKMSERFDCNHYEPPCNCGTRAAEIDNRVEQALAELRVTLDMLGSK